LKNITKRNKGYLFIIIASLLFAMIGIFGKLALNTGLDPFTLIVYQYGLMSILLIVYLLIKDPASLRISRKMLLYTAIQGIIGTAGTTVFYYLAIDQINVGVASMLLFTYPVFVNLFFMFTGIRKITRAGKISLVVAFIGSVLVLDVLSGGLDSLSALGIVFGLLSSLSYAFYNTFADLKLSGLSPVIISFYTSVVALLAGIALTPGVLARPIGWSLDLVACLLMLAVVSGIMPVLLIYRGIALIGADKASIVASSELPITIILAYFALNEQMNLLQISGIIMIVAAVLMLHRSDGDSGSIERKIEKKPLIEDVEGEK
jgi:drug/metabolite transporter (DMT)-like permease